MDISVIGSGRWGSFIAWYLDSISHKVTLYGRSSSERFRKLMHERGNEFFTYSEGALLTDNLVDALKNEILLISVPSQTLRDLLCELRELGVDGKSIILCMKGLEINTGERLSEVVRDVLGDSVRVAVWIGPGHVQDFCAGIPNCMVIDSDDEQLKRTAVDSFSSSLIRFYYGSDLVGNEIGAALKNVIGVAAGMLDGMNYPSLKGALMARGAKEVSRFIGAMGGNPVSAYGLCHLGDYEATLFSTHSHNRRFGEAFVKKEEFSDLAEGYYTVKAVVEQSEKLSVSMPICQCVYNILYERRDPREALGELFERSLKNEI